MVIKRQDIISDVKGHFHYKIYLNVGWVTPEFSKASLNDQAALYAYTKLLELV